MNFTKKVNHNIPIEGCEGRNMVMMEKATSFIWIMKCGKEAFNTYTNKKSALQPVLDGKWIVHNFITVHNKEGARGLYWHFKKRVFLERGTDDPKNSIK